jgi:hypothetical protein
MLICSIRKLRVPEALAPCLTATGHSANGAESVPVAVTSELKRPVEYSRTDRPTPHAGSAPTLFREN